MCVFVCVCVCVCVKEIEGQDESVSVCALGYNTLQALISKLNFEQQGSDWSARSLKGYFSTRFRPRSLKITNLVFINLWLLDRSQIFLVRIYFSQTTLISGITTRRANDGTLKYFVLNLSDIKSWHSPTDPAVLRMHPVTRAELISFSQQICFRIHYLPWNVKSLLH